MLIHSAMWYELDDLTHTSLSVIFVFLVFYRWIRIDSCDINDSIITSHWLLQIIWYKRLFFEIANSFFFYEKVGTYLLFCGIRVSSRTLEISCLVLSWIIDPFYWNEFFKWREAQNQKEYIVFNIEQTVLDVNNSFFTTISTFQTFEMKFLWEVRIIFPSRECGMNSN